ncbi:hypothetical protein [Kineococcus gypseus]|uniref:hypothetical protein n=1 Tax=Kineococcus gypseus TaxID=1637102 RepID=UPI003D7D3E41
MRRRTGAFVAATACLLLTAPTAAAAADGWGPGPDRWGQGSDRWGQGSDRWGQGRDWRGPGGWGQAPAAFPETVPLPTGSLPEGIADGPGTTFYAGSRADGSVVRGDLRTGESEPFVPGVAGRIAVGMAYDERTDRLWVAGGTTGAVTAYDGTTGAELGRWVVPGSGFLNDVAITDDAVHVTDSAVAQLVVVPLGEDGALPGPDGARTVPITGDFAYGEGFNANGVRDLGDGTLVVTQSSTGDLFRLDPATGATDRIELTGRDLTAGDGLVLRGRTLYVVRGFDPADSVAVVRLAPDARSGAVVGELTDEDLDVPTTGILSAGALWLVNGRFTNPDPATADYQVVRVDLPRHR